MQKNDQNLTTLQFSILKEDIGVFHYFRSLYDTYFSKSELREIIFPKSMRQYPFEKLKRTFVLQGLWS